MDHHRRDGRTSLTVAVVGALASTMNDVYKDYDDRKIYLLQEDGSLQPMSERSYVTEDRLQVLLRDYPDLLAGDQMDEENPRWWLLLSREVGIPFEEDGREWMSLDHLFLDQDAIPTLRDWWPRHWSSQGPANIASHRDH